MTINIMRHFRYQYKRAKGIHGGFYAICKFPDLIMQNTSSDFFRLGNERSDVAVFVLHRFHEAFNGAGLNFQALPGKPV